MKRTADERKKEERLERRHIRNIGKGMHNNLFDGHWKKTRKAIKLRVK